MERWGSNQFANCPFWLTWLSFFSGWWNFLAFMNPWILCDGEWGWGNAFEWCAPIIGKGQFSVMNTQVPTTPRSLKCVCCNNRPRNEQLINESSVRFDSIRSPEWGSGASSKFQHPSSLHSLDFSSSSSSPPCCCWCRRRRCYWPIITIAEWQWILNSRSLRKWFRKLVRLRITSTLLCVYLCVYLPLVSLHLSVNYDDPDPRRWSHCRWWWWW